MLAETVIINKYQRIYGSEEGDGVWGNGRSDDGIPVTISTPESSDSDSDNGSDSDCDKDDSHRCIEGVDVGPLSVVDFPRYMTRRGKKILRDEHVKYPVLSR
eukprot:XP_011683224.1 PREDICTED: uncharacterized protein LOC105447172 [Strongylocentrotus purpuratus]